jgi:type IV pilus assembly protein PilV
MRLCKQEKVLSNQSGFTLVEVLVALVILAIGLLGVAGLQNRSLSGNQGALYRSQAVLYANDIIERMRVNRVQSRVVPSPYTIALGAAAAGTVPDPAKADLDDWKAEVGNLPAGDGSVAVSNLDVAKGTVLAVVIVQWNEKGTARSVRVDTEL